MRSHVNGIVGTCADRQNTPQVPCIYMNTFLHRPTAHAQTLKRIPKPFASPEVNKNTLYWKNKHFVGLKGLVHDDAHAHRLSLQNKFVGSTLNSKSPLPVQSLKILRFIRTSVALAGLVILR